MHYRRRMNPEDMYRWHKERSEQPFVFKLPFSINLAQPSVMSLIGLILVMPVLPIILLRQYTRWRRQKSESIAQMKLEWSRMKGYKVGRYYPS